MCASVSGVVRSGASVVDIQRACIVLLPSSSMEEGPGMVVWAVGRRLAREWAPAPARAICGGTAATPPPNPPPSRRRADGADLSAVVGKWATSADDGATGGAEPCRRA